MDSTRNLDDFVSREDIGEWSLFYENPVALQELTQCGNDHAPENEAEQVAENTGTGPLVPGEPDHQINNPMVLGEPEHQINNHMVPVSYGGIGYEQHGNQLQAQAPAPLTIFINGIQYNSVATPLHMINELTAVEYLQQCGRISELVWCFLHIPSEMAEIRKKYPNLLQAKAKRHLKWTTEDRRNDFKINKPINNIVGLLLYVSGNKVDHGLCHRIRAKKQKDDVDNDEDEVMAGMEPNDYPEGQLMAEAPAEPGPKKKTAARATKQKEVPAEPKCDNMWDGCVVASTPEIHRETRGACANCQYNGNVTRCSFFRK